MTDSSIIRRHIVATTRRRLLTAGIALVVAVGVPVVVNRVSVQPGAAIVKWLFELNPLVKLPPDFAVTRAAVSTWTDIPVTVPDAPAARLDLFSPNQKSSAPVPVVLWIHGGGFISGSKEQVDNYAIMLASKGYAVASLDYSIAPGSRYPIPVRQANAALRYLSDHAAEYGGDNTRMFVGGDSAGAQIASQVAAVQSNPALAQAMRLSPAIAADALRGAILFCGLYDMRTVGDTGFPALRTFLWSYTGYRNWLDFGDIDQLSTTAQITAAYPATLLTVGDKDPFEGQGRKLVAALHAKNVPVTAQFYTGTGAGLGHEYQFDFTLPQANQMFATTLAFLSDRAHKGVS